jgi:four helix bundle protein
MSRFDPERMAVYRLARQHSRAISGLLETIGRSGFATLVNQLRRSTSSIPANVLEGFGEWGYAKRLDYLRIAKASALESWAHVDSLIDFGLIDAPQIAQARHLQAQIVALLVTTIRNLEKVDVEKQRTDHPSRSSSAAETPRLDTPTTPG